MKAIFLSYFHGDADPAKAVQRAIESKGAVCWRDEERLVAGSDFAEEIARTIRDSAALVLLLSPESSTSDFVAMEVALARHFHVPIIPVLLSVTAIPIRLLPDLVRLRHIGPAAPEAIATAVLEAIDKPAVQATGAPAFSPLCETATNPSSPLVTNAEYGQFVVETGHSPPPSWSRHPPYYPSSQASAAVGQVSWEDAIAYCDWVGARLPEVGAILSVFRAADAPPGAAAQWLDGGVGHYKYAQYLDGGSLLGLLPRTGCRTELGFRALPVPAFEPRSTFLEEATVAVGPELPVLGEVSRSFRIPQSMVAPVVSRLRRRWDVPGFRLGCAPVTNAEYWQFHKRSGCLWPKSWFSFPNWVRKKHGTPFPLRLASYPVTGVSLSDARKCCSWMGGALPTHLEWERAGAGPQGRRYPWGDAYDSTRTNSAESGRGSSAPADALPDGNTPEGVRQLCGNVFEWVLGDRDEPELRGGSWRVPCELWGLNWMCVCPANETGDDDIGFRVVFR